MAENKCKEIKSKFFGIELVGRDTFKPQPAFMANYQNDDQGPSKWSTEETQGSNHGMDSGNQSQDDKNQEDDSNWYNWNENADRDVVIKIGPLRLYYPNYYSLVSLSLDIFVGILYFIGSLLFLSEKTMAIGSILFVIGGFFFFMRPVVKLLDNFRQYNQVGLKREKDDQEFDDNKFIDVIYSEEVPEEQEEENQIDDYYAEYYEN